MYYDPQHNLVFFTGATYGTFFDSATDLGREIKGAMGMSDMEGGRDVRNPHLENSDCFLGILKLPQPQSSSNNFGNGQIEGMSNPAPWLIHMDEDAKNRLRRPELIYARRFGTPQNSETCSSILMLPQVNDALLQSSAQLKLAMLGHVNPAPLTSAEVKAMGPVHQEEDSDDYYPVGGGERRERRLKGGSRNQQHDERVGEEGRLLGYDGNRGGFLHSLSSSPQPITKPGRSYGFMVDFDVSLTLDETFTAAAADGSFSNAYGALLGGYVLESSPLVYPVAMTQNKRDPNQIYVVSMHMDNDDDESNKIEDMTEAQLLNPEYAQHLREELDGVIHYRADTTVGGAGGSGSRMVGGVPKYGTDFYVKVQSLKVTPYEELMDVEPTPDEKVKRTMTSGWGFGFKLNDANDVRPSSIVFVKGRTPNEDLLLLGGTTTKDGVNGVGEELDGFITKLIPPAPAPIEDQTTGHSLEGAVEDESVHPTKRIDSTTGRDETVTFICLPPANREGLITHAFVVGSTTSDKMSEMTGDKPSMAYILKMRLDDLSIIWKEHLPSIHPMGLGGDVLGEGCAVSPDGARVYLSGTIHGASGVNTGMPNMLIKPLGGLTDVFVVAYDVDFGNVQWAKQLGTAKDDNLARGGGIECDNEGNVIIMGSSRGGVQRYRPDTAQNQYLQTPSSDVFIMSLSRKDGSHVNAPYTGDVPISSSGMTAASSASSVSTTPAEPASASGANKDVGGGMSGGAIAGICLIVIGSFAALAIYVLRGHPTPPKLKFKSPFRKGQQHYDEREGDILRTWGGGDDFSYDSRPSLGGRRDSNMGMDSRGGDVTRTPGGSIRIVRGGDDDWDDGEHTSRPWLTGGGGSNHASDDESVGSKGSKGSYTSKKTEENTDFLAKMRQEANATMKKMVKPDPDGDITADPRLDGGASIKSLLNHYRDVKKDGLLEENGIDAHAGGGGSVGNSGSSRKSPKTSKKSKMKTKPPPPPPPRRKNNDSDERSVDGLSEFTIV